MDRERCVRCDSVVEMNIEEIRPLRLCSVCGAISYGITSLPIIGNMIGIQYAMDLAEAFSLDYIVIRLRQNPELYKPWKFDGCSMIPDPILGITGCDWRLITYMCCLPHDLGYAYGDPHNKDERKTVDVKLYNDLRNLAHMKNVFAKSFLYGVRMGGAEWMNFKFSWAFAER